jgi:hypothetical protein
MNKLTSPLFTKREWGSEVIWALTDDYMAKTIELPEDTQSPLFFNGEKDKSIIVIMGTLYLMYGTGSDDMKEYPLIVGYSWHIDKGMVYKYKSSNESVRLIELSTPHLENNTIIKEGTTIFIPPPETSIPWEVIDITPKKKRTKKK